MRVGLPASHLDSDSRPPRFDSWTRSWAGETQPRRPSRRVNRTGAPGPFAMRFDGVTRWESCSPPSAHPGTFGASRLGGETEDAPDPNPGALDGRESSSLSRGTHHPAPPASPWKGQPRDGGGTCLENRLPLTGRRSSTLLLSAHTNTPPSSSGRGHRSFTAGTRVRIPLGGRLTERGWRKSVSPGLIRQVSPAASAGPAPNAHARCRPALIRPGRGVQLPGEQRNALVAQRIRQRPSTPTSAGSTPAGGTVGDQGSAAHMDTVTTERGARP